jgi:hypothetical protein
VEKGTWEEEAMAKLVLPRVQAMVLCDAIEESALEDSTFNLHGVRSIIEAAGFPCLRPWLCVFAQLSGHAGNASCHLEINRTESDEVVYQTPPRVIRLEGPTTVVPVLFRLRNCEFPAPGVYYVQMFHGSKLIGERPLDVHEGGLGNGKQRNRG